MRKKLLKVLIAVVMMCGVAALSNVIAYSETIESVSEDDVVKEEILFVEFDASNISILSEADTSSNIIKSDYENEMKQDTNNFKMMIESASRSEIGTIKRSGKYENVNWTLYENGLLCVTGEGEFQAKNISDGKVTCPPWYNYADEIIDAEINLKGTTDFSEMFWNCTKLENVRFINSEVLCPKNMHGMFTSCFSLKNIEWGNVDTKYATNMSSLFNNCQNVQEIDLSGLNTISVTDMSYMFSNCWAVKVIILGTDFKVDKVTDMSSMFSSCGELTDIDISSFNTNKVTNMSTMFAGCRNLEKINFGTDFSTSNVVSMEYMFQDCKRLKELNLSKFDCTKIGKGNLSYMLYRCDGLQRIISPYKMGSERIILYTEDEIFYWKKVDTMERVNYIDSNLSSVKIYDKECKFDYWNKFTNDDTYYKNVSEFYYITDEDYNRLVGNLSPSDIMNLRVGNKAFLYHPSQYEGLENKNWDGSCYGMSSWVVLQNNKWVTLPMGLKGTVFDYDIESKINFYHFQQSLNINYVHRREFLSLSPSERISKLRAALANGRPVVIEYESPKNDGSCKYDAHAVCGLSIQYLGGDKETESGKDISNYDYCVVVYDPNAVKISSRSDRNIYFKNDGSFYIPYNDMKSNIGDTIRIRNVIGEEKNINPVDYYSGVSVVEASYDDEAYYLRLELGREYDVACNGCVVKINEDGIIEGDKYGLDVMPDIANGEECETITVILPKKDEYSISAGEGFYAYFMGGYFTTYASIEAGGEIVFKKDGNVEINVIEETSKSVCIGINDGIIDNPWNFMDTYSDKGNKLLISIEHGKYVVEGDDLDETKVRLLHKFEDNSDYIKIPSDVKRAEFTLEQDDSIIITTDVEEEEISDPSYDEEKNDNDEMVENVEGLTFAFTITDSWAEGYNATLKITNNSEKTYDNWKLLFDYSSMMSNIWNAYVVTHKNDTYLIKNVEYNQDLEPGKTVEIGFTFQGDFEDKPRNYRLLEEMSMNTLEDYAISFDLISNWDNGGTTNLTIANNSLNVIEDWIIEFDYEADIVDIWNADILEHTGNHYVLKNKQYNAYIQAGGNVTIGFNFSADSIDDEPKNYMLYNRN